jgi:uncharacterized RDD family membrane protein YckC
MPTPQDYRASSAARVAAYFFDLIAASSLFLLVGAFVEAAGTKIEVSLLYPGCLFVYSAASLARTKQFTLGKYLRDIAVVSDSGSPLNPAQAVLRSFFFALPYACLTSGPVQVDVVANGLIALAPLSGALFLLAEVLLLEYSSERRTLADRASGTVVVRLPPLQPHRAPAAPMFSTNDAEFGNPPKLPPR